MVKTFDPADYSHGGPVATQVKAASSGLRGSDLRAFIKAAGHHVAELVRRLEFSPGEVPVHLIAMGATEAVGPNRNGDGWTEGMLRRYHPTFEKFARAYREHQNADPARSYGVVKRSLYNPDMRRVELVVAYNGTKEAADRNKGLVADRELEKLAAGEDLSVSMSGRVPEDVCSWCGNRARTRAEYCDEGTCPAGGLKRNIGTILKCGHHLHADNPAAVFFDISHVGRPADRTAYATGVLDDSVLRDAGEKRASAAPPLAPSDLPDLPAYAPSHLDPAFWAPRPLPTRPAWLKPAAALAALARSGCVLTPGEHLALGGGLPAGPTGEKAAAWALAQAPALSLSRQHLLRRADRALLGGAAAHLKSGALSRHPHASPDYAAYAAAALALAPREPHLAQALAALLAWAP